MKSIFMVLACFFVLLIPILCAGQISTASTIKGTVVDPSGSVVPNATVMIDNPVSEYKRTAVTDASGNFSFTNVPFNPYHMTITNAQGFAPYVQDVEVRSGVALVLNVKLQVAEAATTVTVTGDAGDLVENEPTTHVDVDRNLFEKLPLESASSSVSSLVTLATPGVAEDSNGLFHGLGDHAENSFSVDGQPITDQQSKVFSNQIPINSVQSLEVIEGAPPADYGDKTSVVIKVTTRSGQGLTTPKGDITTSYGSFGTSDSTFDLGYGGTNWGNFIEVDGLDTGRFLDPPEFAVLHDHGNEENAFDRVDYQLSGKDSLHLNLNFSRSWFQTPNTFDNIGLDANAPGCSVVDGDCFNYGHSGNGPTDQRSKIVTYNLAPNLNHIINDRSLITVSVWARHDNYDYYPSDNPLADWSSLQEESVAQQRSLFNTGGRVDYSYVKGINNIKIGGSYEQTFLTENDSFGIVDPGLVARLAAVNPAYGPLLSPYDLTTGGAGYLFHGHADIKETSLYALDAINKGPWSFNLGVRGDFYNGLSIGRQAEPRAGASYNIKKTSTVLRLSYAHTLETPFNENLIIADTGCNSPVLSVFLLCSPGVAAVTPPGIRNEYHAGLEQAFGKHFVIDGEYIWKYTHNAYDFSVVGDTPITYPIAWTKSKIPGFALRASVPNTHGLSAFVVMSSVAARFFTPQIGGAGAVPTASAGVFRIDHDERFNLTAHLQYQPWHRYPAWLGFNARFDSGLVAGAVPCYGINSPFNDCPQSTTLNGQPAIEMLNIENGLPFSPDQEFEAGFYCGSQHATPTIGLPSVCPASLFGSTLVSVAAPGTENDDHNPPRIDPKALFDVSVGDDNLFHGEKYKWSMTLSAINVANQYALYNFLSTFSGTHYVTPRTLTAQLGFHF